MEKIDEITGAIYRLDKTALARFTPAEINLIDEDGRTPLMHAVLAENADPGIVQLLLDLGADVRTADTTQQWTALHFAARDQKVEVVRVLLQAEAAVDGIDIFGNTPLWRCLMHGPVDPRVIKALINYGADPRKKNLYGMAPIDLARAAPQVGLTAFLTNKQSDH